MNSHGTHPGANGKDYQVVFFSELVDRKVCESRRSFRIGKLTDLVFRMADPYPERSPLHQSRLGKPTELIPSDRVVRLRKCHLRVAADQANSIRRSWTSRMAALERAPDGQDHPRHERRQIEVVNDVHLLESKDG